MKRTLALLGTLFLLTGCSAANETDYPEKMPDDFDICYQYWIGEKNILDTYENYIQKDLVTLDPVQTEFIATEEEKQTIYEKIIELDIASINREMTSAVLTTDDTMMDVTPCTYYDIRFTIDGKEYHITGDETAHGYRDSDEDAGNFIEFTRFMIGFMTSTDEYASLPEAEGGYE